MGNREAFASYGNADAATVAAVAPLAFGRNPVAAAELAAPALVAGDYRIKRLLDLVVAVAAIFLLAPLMLLIWLAVYVTCGGPGLFWSQRVGRDGRLFWMPKYRTMCHDAPLSPREALEGAEGHITPLGAWLRRSALDELPQLYCILMGDMSIIGPRPLLPSDPAVAARRHFPDAMAARPGLSGLAQVVGRNSVTPRRKARLDAFYARSTSFSLDAQIFWRTAGIVLTSRGFI